jgi:hypothetical protein
MNATWYKSPNMQHLPQFEGGSDTLKSSFGAEAAGFPDASRLGSG